MRWDIFKGDLGGSISGIYSALDMDVTSGRDLFEAVVLVNMKMVADLHAMDHIKISGHLDFVILDRHIHSVVNIGPLWSTAELLAV